MRSEGLGGDPVQLGHLLLATSHALTSRGNSQQQVFRDAHLAPGATAPEDCSLPESVRLRIRAVVRSRDRERVREELSEILGRVDVPVGEQAALQQTFEGILRHGIDLVRQRGEDGRAEFLARLDAWSARRRRKGGQGWLRCFLNLLAYECKVSFYTCYANVWVDLIPWLRRHRGLDPVSERFLRFWHMQNQPVELPDGRLLPDVFSGQVLSLHPLSGFFMKDSGLCAIAGRFFGSEAHDRALHGGDAEGCPEYWDLVGAILSAAHLYRQALDDQGRRRGTRRNSSSSVEAAAVGAVNQSDAGFLEDFAAARGLRCPGCGGPLCLRTYVPAAEGAEQFAADFHCPACATQIRHVILRADLESWLLHG
jgi:hypothetical protein